MSTVSKFKGIGEKIRKVRELRRYKQEYVAQELGLGTTAYGNIERDETDVSEERLEQIAEILGVSKDFILSFDEKIIFNVTNNGNSFGGNYSVNNYGLPEQERILWEERVKLLEEKIQSMQKGSGQ